MKRIVKVFGMVQFMDTFTKQPKVIIGSYDLIVVVFGEKGKSTQSAVGMSSLSRDISAG